MEIRGLSPDLQGGCDAKRGERSRRRTGSQRGDRPCGGIAYSRRAQKSISAQRYMVDEANLDWLASCPHFIKDGSLLYVHGDVYVEGDELKAGFGYVFCSEDVHRS